MFRHESRSGDRAVSEVVGVILMVAVTVLLAATAATLFFGFQERTDDAHPSTAFVIDYEPTLDSDTVEISHASGDSIAAGNLEVVITGADATAGDPDGRYSVAELSGSMTPGSTVSAGDTVALSPRTMADVPGGVSIDFSAATVRVVWVETDRTTTLQTWYGPDR